MANFKLKIFSEVKHLLPHDCLLMQYQEDRLTDEDHFLLADGNCDVEYINLDKPSHLIAETDDDTHITSLLILGDLTVKNYVFNENTDGATGIIVLGNLCAKNMLVGGQEIYVTGNLSVEQLFWGDYNHGDLTVKGHVSAKVFTDTEAYHVNIASEKSIGYHLSNYDKDGHWADLDETMLYALLNPILIFEDEDISLTRDRDTLNHLHIGNSLLTEAAQKNTITSFTTDYTYEELLQLVTVEKVKNMLLLPMVIEKYNDYYDTDKNGYWNGNLKFSFRQPNPDQSDMPRVGVSKEISESDEDDEFDCNFYHYQIEQDSKGNEAISVLFQPHNGYEHEPEPIQPHEKEHIQQAYKRFLRLEKNSLKANQKYLEDIENEKQKRHDRDRKIATQLPYAQPEITLNEITFSIIRIQDAQQYTDDLSWGPDKVPVTVFPNINEDGYFLLAEQEIKQQILNIYDIVNTSPPDLIISGIIFLKNVEATVAIFSQEIDVSPFTVFMGNVVSKNIVFYGNTHFIQGNLECEFLFGHYNHGDLYVNGSVTATAIAADDFKMYLGTINGLAIADFGYEEVTGFGLVEDEDGSKTIITLTYSNTHAPEEIFTDALVKAALEADEDFPDFTTAITIAIEDNLPVVDRNKIAAAVQKRRQNIAQTFSNTFAHPYFLNEERWSEDNDRAYHSINIIGDQPIFTISYMNQHLHFLIQALTMPSQDIWFVIYIYEANNEITKAKYDYELNDNTLMAWSVLYTVEKAVNLFLEGNS